MLSDIRCTAPGKFPFHGRKICGVPGAQYKITQRMTGPQTPVGGWQAQPNALCPEHWEDYPEVQALDGSVKVKRKFPG